MFKRALRLISLGIILAFSLFLYHLERGIALPNDSSVAIDYDFIVRRQHLEKLFSPYSEDKALIHAVAYYTIKFSDKHNLPSVLVAAIIIEESDVNPKARGKVGEIGLMQIYPRFWENKFPECGDNLYNIKTNICYGTNILRLAIDMEDGSWIQGTRRYNGSSRYLTKINRRLVSNYINHQQMCY